MTTSYVTAESSAGNPVLNIVVFVAFIVITMAVVLRAGKTTKEASDFYTGGGTFSGKQNGLAIAGDYLSAASFLGIVGAIALSGYDGFLYSIGFFVAWLVALLLVAEPLRNVGRFTMADVLSFRLKQKPVRVAAAFGTLFVSLFYLIAQMAGAGALVSVLLDLHSKAAQSIVVAVVGVIMIVYVLIGGMKGTTYVQMIKAVLLVGGVTIMTVLVFVMVKGGFSNLFDQAVSTHAASDYLAKKGYDASQILEPGLKYGATATSKLDFLSLGIALVLGTAGLPHVLMRFYTVPTATEARRSVTWAIVLIGAFYLMTLVLGFGAAALVGPDRIMSAPGTANAAAPLLALELAGPVFMALISAVAFATVLAVVAGLAITASASVAHDIYDAVLRNGQSTEEEQVRVSRITVIVIGVAAIALGILAMQQNVAFLVSLAFAIAASANLPTILYSLYWKKFNTTGAIASIYTGLGAALLLIVFSPAVSGSPTSMIPGVDFAWFPLTSPGIVSIPLAFLAGYIGTLVGKPDNFDDLQAEMEVRSLTGVGVEAPVDH
ncbi:solute symporter family protein [Corynebacterium pseudotuberculosis]|uniref:solute symporter family protein n=1 Tax=Corynebacterium pseudotuberculosis TaxID=1719 RepID=UPI00071940C6|nr:cation acetate symporter [Corynebacterium pseudotuberculosis]ALP34684.1 Cation/acetate symporter ActP [Corynebacterium pseudotuberculosis]ALR33250.1 cation/acetate symporter ActP [Corynebacterium pseudotuberculosis]APX35753.1 cation acetate symporter [Corynebacterium pseudotuberculosis]APX38728.1 cation acetate symporter [Corynebacterium pseudotuberculosis]AQL50727.1 putative transport protein [Corynebacterium pseudotuberculosis]